VESRRFDDRLMHIPVADGTVTQRWGYTGLSSNGPYYDNRFSPAKYYPSGFHTGVDLAGARGSAVRNTEHGIVVAASWNGCEPSGSCWGYGGGYVVIVRHNSTPVYTSHAHMQRLYVRAGQPVHRGQRLGELDTAGFASGPHDHCSLWVRGLWWTSNRAYTLDPWSSFYGDLKRSPLLNPASMRVPLNVNLRARPTINSRKVGVKRKRYVLPRFKLVTSHDPVPGYTNRTWILTWYGGRWCYAFAPLTETIRTMQPTDRELMMLGGVPLDESGGGLPPGAEDAQLASFAPSPMPPVEARVEDEPEGASWRSYSSVAHLADAEDAF
jgi:hypothetical protein